MVIAIDGLVFQTKPTGVGRYYIAIVEELHGRLPQVSFIIFSNKHLSYIPDFLKGCQVVIDKPIFSRMKYIVWLKFFAQKLLKRHNVNFYFSCNTFLPRTHKGIKTIGIIHDFNYLLAPETMPITNFIAHKLYMRKDCQHLDFIISNTKATAMKAKKNFNVNVDEVIHPEIASIFTKRDISTVKKYLHSKEIIYPYLLCVATLEPRKNVDFCIKSFIELKVQGHLRNYKLLLVGSKGWKNNEVEQLIKENRKDILALGYVSDEYLSYLYNGASLFLFPSKYEGFGIPVREALQSGCNVLTTKISELTEVGGEDAIYFNPDDREEFKAKILENCAFRSVPNVNYSDSKCENLIRFISKNE